jgi:voltage-gated sodium channel
MGANLLFGHLAPEYFGNPLSAFYTLFKVFTIEGWYEVPDQLVANGLPTGWAFLLRAYFIVAVLMGGILGLSLANAVFVDEMTADNNERLEFMVQHLQHDVGRLQQSLLDQQSERLDEMQHLLHDVLRRLSHLPPDDSA